MRGAGRRETICAKPGSASTSQHKPTRCLRKAILYLQDDLELAMVTRWTDLRSRPVLPGGVGAQVQGFGGSFGGSAEHQLNSGVASAYTHSQIGYRSVVGKALHINRRPTLFGRDSQ